MRIGFDAKRVFQNNTGLGNYSRTLINSLAKYFPANEYFLFAPKQTSLYTPIEENKIKIITPSNWLHKKIKSLWRRRWAVKDLKENNIEIYHGLSHLVPNGIKDTNIPAVVTIHDLIFERYPHQYSFIDRINYRTQFKNACHQSNKIIAISEQTKTDLIEFYKVPSDKIDVCYQSCNPIFRVKTTEVQKDSVRKLYQLPAKYFLFVGSIIERKNLLIICKAFLLLKGKLDIPLVVIGNGKKYKEEIKNFVRSNNIEKKVIFMSDNEEAKTNISFKNSEDFPAIYQQAVALIYPSIFEGFGIPILEALCSGLPVISSNASCLPEAGCDAALYFNPADEKELAKLMLQVSTDDVLRQQMINKGFNQAQKFTEEKCAKSVMDVYKKVLDKNILTLIVE